MGNLVAIVGRPNVGKSTFFNRLTGQKKAIVHESSGVTRDRHYGKSFWNGIDFSVVDTGGYINNSEDIFEKEIKKQVVLAIEEADIILFLVDVFSGVTISDEEVANILRKSKKKVFLVVNKTDNNKLLMDADLLDEVVDSFIKENEEEEIDIPKFAIVGRPNVGKSSLINALIGEERNIVTKISGTTRDTINTPYNKFGHNFILVDTAGVRKKNKVNEDVEFYSVIRSIRAIESSDVCLLMIDATHGVESQDVNIFEIIRKNHKGVVVIINKWDLVEEKETNTAKNYQEEILKKFAPFVDIPIIFASVKNKQRVLKSLDEAIGVYKNRKQKISTSKLNEVMLPLIDAVKPPSLKGKFVKIKYVTQLPTHAPNFAFFCNLPQYIKESYKRYLENSLRKKFNFTGVPINIFMRKK
ncbi:MAG: ribosome biogenesis GTPase Der [Bacteroidetes bacterium 4572_128]|nr:MAG: ribosome biogenesis GTPase Der [Bacteroidetes bacterium 4572_128]